MKTYSNPTYTNVPFIVTKDTSNPNGFLLPHILFDHIKTVATYPLREFYSSDTPQVSDYKFKMHKNAFLNDKLTIQAQLIKNNPKKLMVSIIVTKTKKSTKTEETISSALFDFPISERSVTGQLAS